MQHIESLAATKGYPLREVFNGLRWLVRAGAAWRMMPNDLPPWHVVYDQTRRWLKGVPSSPRRRFWIAGPCSPAQKAARARAMMGPSEWAIFPRKTQVSVKMHNTLYEDHSKSSRQNSPLLLPQSTSTRPSKSSVTCHLCSDNCPG